MSEKKKKNQKSSEKASETAKAVKETAKKELTEKETAPIAEAVSETVSEAAEGTADTAAEIISEAKSSGETAAPAAEAAAEEAPATFLEKAVYLKKRYGKKTLDILTYVMSFGIFAYVVYYLVYFITVAYKKEFHSDCTDTIMWANASVESGHIYDEAFGYACFLPFGINVIMQPLIGIFGLTMKAHVWGMMSYFILLTVFFILMLREMHWDIRAICLGTSVMLAMTTSSEKLREIFWQHTIYYSLGILFIVIGLFLYFRMMNLSEKLKTLKPDSTKGKITFLRCLLLFLILAVFIMFTATDGISALSIFAVPLVGAILAEHFADTSNKLISKKSLLTVAMSGIFGYMIILGGKVNKRWAGDLVAGYQDANSIYSPMSEWTDHTHSFPLAWMKLNGVKDMGYAKLNDKDGIQNLIYIAASLLLLVLPIVATFFYPKFKKAKDARMLRLFVWMHWASSGIVLLGYIVGVISAADWRITPIVGTSLILSILFVHWAVTNTTSASRVVAVLSIPIIMVSILNIKNIKEMPRDGYKENNLFGLAEFLEDSDLSYGYATFWNANAITIISDSKVKVRDVNVDQNGVSKRVYQASDNWYKDQEDQDDYFLLLSPPELQVLSDIQSPLFNEAMDIKNVYVNNTEYTVLIFDHNIIPQW